jgi:hypothetical protein
LSSNIGWNILLGNVVAFIVFEEVRDIEKAVDTPILVRIVCRECLEVIFEVLREGDV